MHGLPNPRKPAGGQSCGPTPDALTIDGAWGEGGGQILRTSLALSLLVGRPMQIERIRAGRSNPGLQAQHLTAVRVARAISGGRLQGDAIGSSRIAFMPGVVRAGQHRFDVGAERASAGSVSLVAQTVLLPLALRGEVASSVHLRGGTHVSWSPSLHYLNDVYLPLLAALGIEAQAHLHRWGFYPRGQGEMTLTVSPCPGLRGRDFLERGALREIQGVSAVCNLPRSIAARQRDSALQVLKEDGLKAEIQLVEAEGIGQGTFVFLVARFEEMAAGFSSLRERGKPAERVGEEAGRALLEHYRSNAALDPHLADQAVLPMALASSTSFTTSRVTRHLLTNLWVLRQFLPVQVELEGQEGAEGRVTIRPTPQPAKPSQ